MKIESEHGSKWDAALERRGVASVVAIFSANAAGTGTGSDFPLNTQGMPTPSRGYVEDWLLCKEAQAAEVVADRHQQLLVPAQGAARWALWACILGGLALVVAIVGLFKQH